MSQAHFKYEKYEKNMKISRRQKGLHIFFSVRKPFKHLAGGGGRHGGYTLQVEYGLLNFAKPVQNVYERYNNFIWLIHFCGHTLPTSSLASSLDFADHASKFRTCLQAICLAKSHNENSTTTLCTFYNLTNKTLF